MKKVDIINNSNLFYNIDDYFKTTCSKFCLGKPMDKQVVIKQLRDLNLPKDEYYVLSGASLVLRGIREKCSDIDLCISEELFSSVKGWTKNDIGQDKFL